MFSVYVSGVAYNGLKFTLYTADPLTDGYHNDLGSLSFKPLPGGGTTTLLYYYCCCFYLSEKFVVSVFSNPTLLFLVSFSSIFC